MFLKQCYARNNAWREVVQEIAESLQTAKHLYSSGVVGSKLKSAAFYSWCSQFFASPQKSHSAKGLFNHLATFQATQLAVEIDLKSNSVYARDRTGHWNGDALVVRQVSDGGSRNAAASMSEVSLAKLQWFCYIKSNLQSMMHKEVSFRHFDFSDKMTISRHQVGDYVMVACIWPNPASLSFFSFVCVSYSY